MRSSLSFGNFKAQMHHLAHALSCFPEPLLLRTSGSPVTLAAKLRDAKLAKTRFGYMFPNSTDEHLWNQYGSKLHISIMENKVRIGPLPTKPDKAPGIVELTTTAFTPASPVHLEWICQLLGAGCFSPPLQLTVQILQPEKIPALERDFNVAFVPTDEANTYTLA